MAVEIFFKLEGVDGESETAGFEKQIEVFSFSQGVSNPSSVATGGGSGAGKADFSSLAIQKQVDMASCKLFGSVAKGTHFGSGTLTVREAGGDNPLDFYILEFKQVFCDSVSWGGTSGGGKPSESLSFSFETIKLKYLSQTESGGKGGKDEFGWSVKQNTAV